MFTANKRGRWIENSKSRFGLKKVKITVDIINSDKDNSFKFPVEFQKLLQKIMMIIVIFSMYMTVSFTRRKFPSRNILTKYGTLYSGYIMYENIALKLYFKTMPKEILT